MVPVLVYCMSCYKVLSIRVLMFGYQCEIESEKKRCDEGIKKAQALVDEAQIKLDQENEKIHQAESQVLVYIYEIMCVVYD